MTLTASSSGYATSATVSKTRKQTECDGQTGYTAKTLDGIVDKLVRQIFEHMKAVPRSEVVGASYKEKMEERKALLRLAKAEYTKADMIKMQEVSGSYFPHKTKIAVSEDTASI